MTCRCPEDKRMKYGTDHAGACLTEWAVLANRVLDIAQTAPLDGVTQKMCRALHSDLMMEHFREVA